MMISYSDHGSWTFKELPKGIIYEGWKKRQATPQDIAGVPTTLGGWPDETGKRIALHDGFLRY